MNKRKSCSNEAVGVECMLWQEMDWAEHHCSGSGRIQYLKQRSIVLKKDAEGWFRGIFLPRKPISGPFVLWILPTLLLICEERALTNKLCLTKFLWEVLRYTQSGFALVLLQIPVFYTEIEEMGRIKEYSSSSVCLNLFGILNCIFTILNLSIIGFCKY